jgi:pantetheine-phosphate adenylyltransferase
MRTVAVYTGSFNTFHKGHLDILNKAKRMFDEVVIAVGHNPDKYMLSEVHQRIETIEAQLPDQKVLYYNGFTTDLLDSLEVNDVKVVLVRGLRNGVDLDYEIQQLRFIEDACPEINVVMIPCSRELAHISSSMIRTIGKFDETKMSKYLP